MQTQSGFQALSEPAYGEIGSFLVTEVQRTRFTAAMNIAKQMHVPGDDDQDDAIRAIVLLQGGAYFDDEWHGMQAADEEDYDRQVNAYYDGAAELSDALGRNHDQTHWRMVG